MALLRNFSAVASLLATAATAAASDFVELTPAADAYNASQSASPSTPQRSLFLIPSELRKRDDVDGNGNGERCVDFGVRARSPYWPSYRAAHVLQNHPTKGFTVDVRAGLVAMGEAVAAASGGWRTDRHDNYPTTDFSVKDDLPPRFSKQVLALARLWVLPHVAELAGVFASDLRLADLFIVKYEVREDGSSQQQLAPHEDGSTWTFSMGLNNASEYEGGGCRFHQHSIGDVHSSSSTVLMHYGKLRHEGLRITSGKRYLLVGFVYHREDCEYS